jgi:hypothetical protein
MENGRLAGSSCDNCHTILLHGSGGSAAETLNRFGADYLRAGRSVEALLGMEGEDSDGDGFPNGEELASGRYPGSALSRPGQETAVTLTVPLEEVLALPDHSQFMLVNNTQKRLDEYVTYRGVPVEDFLAHLEVDLSGTTGITVIAPDGYQKSLSLEMVTGVHPQPIFHEGLGPETLGSECALVNYPEELPAGVAAGFPIPGEHRLLLGFEHNGEELDPVRLDVTEGKIEGEGPLRLVVPEARPGTPDRGSSHSPSGCRDGYDFSPDTDHNAGHMVRGVVAIRIDPMPLGVEEFDFMNGGWAYLDAGELIIYGHGVGRNVR